MAYCYECGEQVAENDVFCPFCGISLQPIAVAGTDEDEDPYSKTIAVQQPIAPTSSQPSVSENKKVDENQKVNKVPQVVRTDEQPLKERLVADITNQGTTDHSNDRASGNLEVKSDAFDNQAEIPTPKILETIQPVSGTPERAENCSKNNKTDSAELDFSTPETDLEENEASPAYDSAAEDEFDISEFDVSHETDETTAASQTESSLMSYEEAEVKDVLSPDEPDKSINKDTSKHEAFEKEQPNKIDLGVFNIKEEAAPLIDEKESTDSETSNKAEPAISMPQAQLPVSEDCPPSKFDSVSIMEKNESTDEKPAPDAAENSIHNAAEDNNVSVAQTAEDNRSHTTPNIGGNDTDGKGKAKLKPLDEGTVLNARYEIIRKIGGGGMGAVYLASDKNLGGVLRAVKEMVQSYIEDEQQEKAVNDFKRESLLLTSLDHQSIPTIYDYFFDEKEARFYLVMKYISGGDLAGRLRSAPESRIDEASVTSWATQIADVLDYLHNRQPPIVYRDLKPANIMVDGNSGRVMLIDFGIARWVNKEEKGVTAVGTMGYAPPELFSGNVEPRSDIYSLGSTMFHLLTGADPQSNPLLIFDFQKHPRPRQINPQLSDQMERILMRAVEYNADKRFTSAAEMRQVLEEHRENLKAGRITYGVKEAPISVSLSDQPVFCGFCGQKIVATDMFCAFCGAKQPLAQQGVHSQQEGYAPAPLTAQLLIIGTNELEQPAYRLEKDENLVGRRDPMSNIFPEVDLSKFDPQTKISRRHARIWREGSEFMVEDLGSSNGTYILPVISDSMRLQPHQPQLLTNGDKLRLGDTTLHFVLG